MLFLCVQRNGTNVLVLRPVIEKVLLTKNSVQGRPVGLLGPTRDLNLQRQSRILNSKQLWQWNHSVITIIIMNQHMHFSYSALEQTNKYLN